MELFNDIEQRTPEWFEKRRGKVTGKRAAALGGTPHVFKGLCWEIAGEMLMTPREDLQGLTAAMRGTMLEPEARAAVQLATGLTIYETGMAKSEEEGSFIAFSPDGLASNNNLEPIRYAVEIKCPEIKAYTSYLLNEGVPPEYVEQCTMPFLTSPDIEYVIFAAYNPEVPIMPLYLYMYSREEASEMIEKLEMRELELREMVACHTEQILLLSKRDDSHIMRVCEKLSN